MWIIARQHPGESMGSVMEGFLARLLDPDDAIARQLQARATFHVVPHMAWTAPSRATCATTPRGPT